MTRDITSALDREISQLESQLSALRAARAALGGGAGVPRRGRRAGARRTGARKPGQRNFTAAQRAEQSRKMKIYWAKRRREKEKKASS
jgi:hypothetical protein